MRATMMLGEVPISVMSPPRREPKESGISRRETGVLLRRENCMASGMKIASAPIFLMKAERAVTAPPSTATCAPVVRI